MPTQEELNAAQMELDIANDNYAAMANRYNKFQDLFKAYAKASPEMQDRAAESIGYALEEFHKLQQDMYAAEDRIQQAQNKWNNYNEIIANQPQQTSAQGGQRRRQINPNHYFGGEGRINNNGTLTSPDGQTIIYPDGSIQFGVEPELIQAPAPETTLETIPEQNPALLGYQSPMSNYSRTLINKGNSTQYTPTQPTSNVTPLSTWGNGVSTLKQNNQSRIYPIHVNGYTGRLGSATIAPKGYVNNNLRGTKKLNTWGSGVGTL